MDAVIPDHVLVGTVEMTGATFALWQLLQQEAEFFRSRGEEVPKDLRKKILLAEGTPEDDASYLVEFPEEAPELLGQSADVQESYVVSSLTWHDIEKQFLGGAAEIEKLKEKFANEYNCWMHTPGTWVATKCQRTTGAIEVYYHIDALKAHPHIELAKALREVATTHVVGFVGRGASITLKERGGEWILENDKPVDRRVIGARNSRNGSVYFKPRETEPA
jgi:hypothetical protein